MSFSKLLRFLMDVDRTLIITGAGCSAPSGIDTYRDDAGRWRRSAPIQHQDFISSERARKRYWARSMRGWPSFRDALPNPAHEALVAMEKAGRVQRLVTQNVDGLHQRAGQSRPIELHGSLARVLCLACGQASTREGLQHWLVANNARWLDLDVEARPDGDAEFRDPGWFEGFTLPVCGCGGLLKPDVVFYGDSVPLERVAEVRAQLAAADALLVIGSSLMVYSSYRFLREARAQGKPMAAINRGRTRADEWFDCKWEADIAVALPQLLRAL